MSMAMKRPTYSSRSTTASDTGLDTVTDGGGGGGGLEAPQAASASRSDTATTDRIAENVREGLMADRGVHTMRGRGEKTRRLRLIGRREFRWDGRHAPVAQQVP